MPTMLRFFTEFLFPVFNFFSIFPKFQFFWFSIFLNFSLVSIFFWFSIYNFFLIFSFFSISILLIFDFDDFVQIRWFSILVRWTHPVFPVVMIYLSKKNLVRIYQQKEIGSFLNFISENWWILSHISNYPVPLLLFFAF